MALVNRSFSVNVTPGMMPPIVHVSEYDVGRAYTVSILDEQGSTFTIPSGTTASIEGTLNGSVGFTQSATVSNNQVSFTLSESMTAYSGKAWCKIKLVQNSQPIQTCAFVLAVDRAGVEADTVINSSGFEDQLQTAFTEYLEKHGTAPVGSGVSSVNGKSGVVVLSQTDIERKAALPTSNNEVDLNDVTAPGMYEFIRADIVFSYVLNSPTKENDLEYLHVDEVSDTEIQQTVVCVGGAPVYRRQQGAYKEVSV